MKMTTYALSEQAHSASIVYKPDFAVVDFDRMHAVQYDQKKAELKRQISKQTLEAFQKNSENSKSKAHLDYSMNAMAKLVIMKFNQVLEALDIDFKFTTESAQRIQVQMKKVDDAVDISNAHRKELEKIAKAAKKIKHEYNPCKNAFENIVSYVEQNEVYLDLDSKQLLNDKFNFVEKQNQNLEGLNLQIKDLTKQVEFLTAKLAEEEEAHKDVHTRLREQIDQQMSQLDIYMNSSKNFERDTVEKDKLLKENEITIGYQATALKDTQAELAELQKKLDNDFALIHKLEEQNDDLKQTIEYQSTKI